MASARRHVDGTGTDGLTVDGFARGPLGRTRKMLGEKRPDIQIVGDELHALQKVQDFSPAPYTVLGWEVQDIESVVNELKSRGVAFEKYPFIQDQEFGIWSAPGGAKVAWFKDPDGNVLSVSQANVPACH